MYDSDTQFSEREGVGLLYRNLVKRAGVSDASKTAHYAKR